MSAPVEAAEVALGLEIAHYLIQARNLRKCLLYGSRRALWRIPIGHNVEDRSHGILALVNRKRTGRWAGCARGLQPRQHKGRGCSIPAHKARHPFPPGKSRFQSAPELIAPLRLALLSTAACRKHCRERRCLPPECKPYRRQKPVER